MRKKWNPGIRVFVGVVLIAAILSGCGSKTAGSGSAQNGGQNTELNTMQDTTAQGNSDSQKVRKVYVAVGATFEPYTYIDENNQPAGYDVAVLQEIDNRLPQYEFQIENMELANISVALDAKKVSIGFASYNKRLVYKKGRDDIHSIDDLAEKKVSAGQGSNTAAILETYNAEHDNKIDIVYSNGATSESIYDDVMNGRLDAIVATKKTFKKYNEAFGGGYDINEDSYFSESQAYFMLAQGEEQLRDDMDTALKAMKEDGTLTKLSIEYTGSDYNSEE